MLISFRASPSPAAKNSTSPPTAPWASQSRTTPATSPPAPPEAPSSTSPARPPASPPALGCTARAALSLAPPPLPMRSATRSSSVTPPAPTGRGVLALRPSRSRSVATPVTPLLLVLTSMYKLGSRCHAGPVNKNMHIYI